MANEITTQIKTTLINPLSSTTAALLKENFDEGIFKLTQTTQAAFADVVTVGFGAEQDLVFPTNSKMTTALQGLFCAINLDATNFVKMGPKAGGGSLTLLSHLWPKTPVQIPIAPNVVIRWQADTAACDVLVVWLAK